jgi:glycosyltransferase involved in cell wall biosynthesis
MSADAPLVSCIMPTKDRRAFAERAIDWFVRQDYPNRELIIVDEGRDRIADLAARDPRIRYVPLERRLTLGAKRNLACEHASGTLIAHWDDDDWHAPTRLSQQVSVLRDAAADLCGTDRLLFYDVDRQRAYEYVYPGSGRRWLAGGTLLYRREWWRTHPFANINIGEDGAFVAGARGARIAVVPDPLFYIATIHRGNTSPKHTAGSAWHAYPVERVRDLVGDDWPSLSGERVTEPAPLPPMDAKTRVTVSIPAYAARPYLVQAVETILAQTYQNIRLVVVNDGDPESPWDLLAHIDDPRLVRFDLNANRGRYFADAIVLEATPDRWLLLQDADDWSEPDRLAELMTAVRAAHASGAFSAGWTYDEVDGTGEPEPGDYFPGRGLPLTPDNDHRVNQTGLFLAEALRAIGGTFGGERIGYDTIIGNFLLMTANVAYVDRPLYHRRIRPDSLTHAPETSQKSPERERVWRRIYELYEPAWNAYRVYLDGQLDVPALAARLRQLRDGRVGQADRAALAADAARLRRLLADQDARWAADPARFWPRRPAAGAMRAGARLASDRRLEWTGWTITPALAEALAERLEEIRPTRILEIGSGNSTVVLAAYAAAGGASVTTLEHEPEYFEATSQLLTAMGLRDHVDLRLTPMGALTGPDRREAPWYDAPLEAAYDFVFVDGPPQRIGREGVLFGIANHLGPEWELWLDDGHREHELACLERWRPFVPFEGALYDVDWKGVWVLHPPDTAIAPLGRDAVAHIRSHDREVPDAAVPRATVAATVDRDLPRQMPLVSAVMPTFDRRVFIPRAIAQFTRQSYPNRELIVVDDGTDPIGDLLPQDPSIRYVRLPTRVTIGSKRNTACELARGDIVIGWDDDDWYHPDRIARQVEPIVEGRADVVGLGESIMVDLVTNRYWRCAGHLQQRIFASGVVSGTVAFRREAWVAGCRYPDRSLAEDAEFQQALVRAGARLLRLPDPELFIYVRHSANSWRFTPGSYMDRSGWRQVPTPAFLGSEDVQAFDELRAALGLAESTHSISRVKYRPTGVRA